MLRTFGDFRHFVRTPKFRCILLIARGRRGLMVMALDCGAGGREFKRFQNIFDLMERFDETV